MDYSGALKCLAGGIPVRRRTWKKHWYCTEIATAQNGKEYMVIPAIKTHQMITPLEINATDWQRHF